MAAEIPAEFLIFKPATRERVRRALASVVEESCRSSKDVVSITKVRGAGSGDQNATTALLRGWREGKLSLAESWEGPATAPAAQSKFVSEGGSDLAELVRNAQTHDDLLAAGKAVALQLLEGLDPERAGALKSLLTEMRQSVKGRVLEPKEVVESILPCTDEAFPLVEAFEGIEDDDARAEVLAFAQERLEADRMKRPSLDTGGAASEGA
jgi:hypothetical protein